MLLAYLDDAGGKDRPVQTIAGFVAPLPDWENFERNAQAIFDRPEFGIEVLNTKQFHHSKGEFRDWDWPRKRAFGSAIFDAVRESLGIWLDFSIDREAFQNSIGKADRRKFPLKSSFPPSPYGYCFFSLIGRMRDDPVYLNLIEAVGGDTSIIVEQGNSNDGDLKQIFDEMQQWPSMARLKLRSMAFNNKNSSRALQVADFYAFYCCRLRCLSRGHQRYKDEYDFFADMSDSIYGISFYGWEFSFTPAVKA